jgi:SAM-dependent methyltransferase
MSSLSASDIDEDEDDVFDHRLPHRLQLKSSIHFTPVAVARLAARLLAPDPGMRVLDVGAGPGKFCVIAAREVPTCSFVGVELRPHLVHLARKLTARLSVPNASFVNGDAFELDWSEYDAFYFYNPFAEQLHEPDFALDRSLTLMPARFLDYVSRAGKRLANARIGTRVVTYHSFGAPVPPGYDLTQRHMIGTDCLELWIKLQHAGAEDSTS